MIGAIVTVFVVLAIFGVVATLLAAYVWRVDPHQIEVWKAVLRSNRERRNESAPRFRGLRIEVTSRGVPTVATVPPVPASGKSAADRLDYWVEDGR